MQGAISGIIARAITILAPSHTLALILGAPDLYRHLYFGEQNGRAPIRDGIAATSNAKGNSMRGISRYVSRNSNGKPPRVLNKLPKACDRYIQCHQHGRAVFWSNAQFQAPTALE